ncbi:MAG: hypothetical protein HQL31_00500 [Planctomycetes bacterium]|nr:hypothetical protein [Planctomycetota bacterium]
MDTGVFCGRRIVVAVTGGIAIYKTCGLVSTLVKAQAQVRVVMTRMAGQLVTPLAFRALSRNPVDQDGEFGEGQGAMEHVDLARWGECLLVSPCTANTLAKLAHGIADDVVSTLALAFSGPILIAPAMNPTMWEKAVVGRNIEILRKDGVTIIPPEEGIVACGDVGVGRLAEEGRILAALAGALP